MTPAFLAIALFVFLSYSHVCAEPMPAQTFGRVILPDSVKLDAKTKRELAAIATKINKSRQRGVVKLTGDVPSSASAEEYRKKSVFLARNVELHLKPLLLNRYQVYITASKYSGEKRVGQNTVAIALYPRELVTGYGASIAEPVAPSAALPTDNLVVREQPVQPVYRQPAQSGLLTPPQHTNEPVKVSSKKEKMTREPEENPDLANELVRKAKARAAEKAKRLQQAN